MHADLDAFYAAIEEKNNPEYTGKPIVVGADPKNGEGRGVVSTCNYKAREYEIHSAMPISRAWKLCPEAIYLPVNMSLYSQVSKRMMLILRSYADKFEQVSIDEAFLDVSQRTKNLDGAENLAKKIKEEIKKKEGLTLSIGIGPNKLIAKIASDFRKPDGLIVIEEKNAEKIERDLMSTIPKKDWIEISYLLINHGRKICKARKPSCPECSIKHLCPSAEKF